MQNLIATRHAQARKQQRGITDIQEQLLYWFGKDHLQKGGTYLTYLPEKTIREIRAALDGMGSRQMIKSASDVVITEMHQTRKTRTTSYKA
jgi:hypothetical protein